MINKFIKLSGLYLFSALTCVAHAQPSSTLVSKKVDGQHLALACLSCHSSSNIPNLFGVPFEIVNKKMQEYAKDLKKDTVMHQLLKGYSEQEIEAMATYFSEAKK
jgi:sulfide dehydrogenase cytochrome subunit